MPSPRPLAMDDCALPRTMLRSRHSVAASSWFGSAPLVTMLPFLAYLAICVLSAWLLRRSLAGFWGILILCFILTPLVVLLGSLLLRPEPTWPSDRARR